MKTKAIPARSSLRSASLGEAKGDEDLGGYHLVWTRDMVNSVTGLAASGELATALRALIDSHARSAPTAAFRRISGSTGSPTGTGFSSTKFRFRSDSRGGCTNTTCSRISIPYPMVLRAAHFLIDNGCATPQERWDKMLAQFRSLTLAASFAALICAACFARDRGDL